MATLPDRTSRPTDPAPGEPLSFDDSVRRPDHVLSRSVGDETILLDLRGEAYYGLDPVGARIWEVVGSSASLEEAAARLVAEFDVDETTLRSDLAALVTDLARAGLVEVVRRRA